MASAHLGALETATDTYTHSSSEGRAPVSVMQDLQGLGSASTGEDPAWCWRLWHGAALHARGPF